MQLKQESQIIKINQQILLQQERLKKIAPTKSLSSFLPTANERQYVGSCDELTDLLEMRIDFIKNRHALIDDVLFIHHQAIRYLVELELPEEHRIKAVSVLEENRAALEKRRSLLHQLDTIYQSLVIEPGTVSIDDGEQPDPSHFRIVVSPIPSLNPTQTEELKKNWWKDLTELEEVLKTPIILQQLQ